MHCPFCSADNTRVTDSRPAEDKSHIRRRRECTACKERFTTYETVEFNFPRIIKSDGRREPFDEKKLRSGLELAISKRPVNTESVERVVAQIKKILTGTNQSELRSMILGGLVMDELRKLDHVAYVRFASVCRGFDDMHAFLEVIELLEKEMPPELRARQGDLLDDIPGDAD